MITLTPQRVQLELVGSQETQLLQTPGTKIKSLVIINIKDQPLLWIAVATHPSPVASIVIAFEQTVNKRTTAALDKRVGVP